MPSVGMRRTRVFGVVKGVDGARVLRSGRRLWLDSVDVKLRKPKESSDWYRIIDHRGNGGGSGQSKLEKWTPVRNVNPKSVVVANIHEDDANCAVELPKPKKTFVKTAGVDKMFGKVYSRKRRRDCSENTAADNVLSGDRMFGLRFIRRQKTKKNGDQVWEPTLPFCSEVDPSRQSISSHRNRALTIFAERRSNGGCFSGLTLSVLRYLQSSVLKLTELYAFLLSDPIHEVFASTGIRFLQRYPSSGSTGFCAIFGAMHSMPLFHLDFSAIPLFLMYLHSRMFLRATWIQARLVYNSFNKDTDVDICSDSEEDTDIDEHVLSLPETSSSGCKIMAFGADHPKSRHNLHPSVRASRLAARNTQYRSGFISRGIRKRRSSLRRRRPRNPSLAAMQRTVSSVVTASIGDVKRGVSFSSSALHKSSALSGFFGRIREVSSAASGSAMDVDSSSCVANILIVESDRCFREEGANIVVEFSASCEWLLVVKKDGITRYTVKAEKVMRPCSSNRYTHAIMWSVHNDLKLEFPNRQDWVIFKDLYKKCSGRNVSDSAAKTIPVPRVSDVPGYVDSSIAPFCRPDSYISLNDDEVGRAIAKATANYDMDSDDEEWLNKFNNELITKEEHHECLSRDNFELMIDSLEKGFYRNPDAFLDEKAPPDVCMNLGSSPIVESVFSYWTKKRRQKKSALLRVFQAHQVKRKLPVAPKPPPPPSVRRRRPVKKQPPLSGRAKQPIVLQAIEESKQDDAMEDEKALANYQEAKEKLEKFTQVAIRKRVRAQLIFENADLAAYKAMMALRIAEAIQESQVPEAAASEFLD